MLNKYEKLIVKKGLELIKIIESTRRKKLEKPIRLKNWQKERINFVKRGLKLMSEGKQITEDIKYSIDTRLETDKDLRNFFKTQ